MSEILKHFSPNHSIKKTLVSIFGIGVRSSVKICEALGVSGNIKVSEMPRAKKEILLRHIEEFYVTGSALKFQLAQRLRSLALQKTYRAIRMEKGLPVRGQRTRSNGKTITRLAKRSAFKF